jgi:hypothetical protein
MPISFGKYLCCDIASLEFDTNAEIIPPINGRRYNRRGGKLAGARNKTNDGTSHDKGHPVGATTHDSTTGELEQMMRIDADLPIILFRTKASIV